MPPQGFLPYGGYAPQGPPAGYPQHWPAAGVLRGSRSLTVPIPADPSAPYGRDPLTGEPLSDKTAITAGLLQFFLGGLGVGRFYIGSTNIGAIQLGLTILGIVTSWLIVGIFICPRRRNLGPGGSGDDVHLIDSRPVRPESCAAEPSERSTARVWSSRWWGRARPSSPR